MKNKKFFIPWKSKISKSSNSSELETFKTRSFEGRKFSVSQKQEVFKKMEESEELEEFEDDNDEVELDLDED
ncbi:MAG: hypothetical protein WC584_04725 [Candidatus Pacearchaeota archaeon]